MALTPAEAAALIGAQVSPQPSERVPLRRALGRILRQPVMPERENPPFDRVCMDGIAIDSTTVAQGRREFQLQGTLAAGVVPQALASEHGAVEVMTGAVLPPGTDCVVPLEEYSLAGRTVTLHAEAGTKPWRNVQRRGEDSRPGVPMLLPGACLGAAELAVVASAGLAEIEVSRRPRVCIVSTGDELVEPGLPIAGHQVRRSNAYAIAGELRAHGFEHVDDDHVRDDEHALRTRLGEHLEGHDALVLSGGVSKGKFDYVPRALAAVGVRELFHEVAQRPGRPFWFGVGARGQLVFGLPGNPVATLVCLRRFVLPALRASLGATAVPPPRHALGTAAGGRKMTYYLPVRLQVTEGGMLAEPRPPNGPGDFLALAGTDGFVELPPRPSGYAPGFVADFYGW